MCCFAATQASIILFMPYSVVRRVRQAGEHRFQDIPARPLVNGYLATIMSYYAYAESFVGLRKVCSTTREHQEKIADYHGEACCSEGLHVGHACVPAGLEHPITWRGLPSIRTSIPAFCLLFMCALRPLGLRRAVTQLMASSLPPVPSFSPIRRPPPPPAFPPGL